MLKVILLYTGCMAIGKFMGGRKMSLDIERLELSLKRNMAKRS